MVMLLLSYVSNLLIFGALLLPPHGGEAFSNVKLTTRRQSPAATSSLLSYTSTPRDVNATTSPWWRSSGVSTYNMNCGAPNAAHSSSALFMSTATQKASPSEGAISSAVYNFVDPLQYLKAIDQTNDGDELLVVKYYASYCKLCQRASINYKKIASGHQENKSPVRFAKIEASLLPPDLWKKMGVTKLPFIQIFRHGRCVASFSTGPSHMFTPKVRDTLKTCLNRSGQEWQLFESQFAEQIQENIQAREYVREYLSASRNIREQK